MNDKKELLSQQYDLLDHKDKGLTEIRVFPKTWFCHGKEEFIQEALKHVHENAYVGIQPRSKMAGDISAINNLTTLCIDVDPVREKDTASTDEQHKAAIELANRIAKDLGDAVVVSSGSGAHVYVPLQTIKVEDRDSLTDSLRKWNNTIKEKYGTDKLKIDNIFDLPRVIRMFGSLNSRSNRVCAPISPLTEIKRTAVHFSQQPKAKKAHVPEVITDELTQKFNRLCRTNKRLKEIAEGSIAFKSPSEADYEFIALLCRAQFTVDEVSALWEYNHGGNKEPKKGDIERVFGKTEDSKDTKAYSLSNNSSGYFANLAYRRMGIRSGFNSLDEMISGFKEGKIYIMAARPGTGKTTLGMQILTNMAEEGIPCLMFPTEVGSEPLIDKILSRKCKISLKKFQNGTFTKEDVSKIEEMKGYIGSLPLTIYDDFGLDIDAYEAQVDKYAPKVVCLDYFQSLKFKDPASVGEKEDAVRRIKKLTKDRNIVTICMSQLNRNTTGKAGMAELKGTGALEEYADCITQMYRGEGHNYPTPIDMIVTKSKYSATGNINLSFYNSEANFVEDEIQGIQRTK
jgi:KaiC/GvpD/RAD55 family RecA-like ATPase